MNQLKKELKKHIFKVIFGLIIIVIIVVQLEKVNTWLFNQGPLEIQLFFNELGFYAIPFFITIYVIGNIFLIPSYFFVFTSGMVFGVVGGVIASLISEVLSATTNFYIGRKTKKIFFVGKSKHKRIEAVKEYINNNGFIIILILRYLGFYFDIVSYVAGRTKILYTKYIVATFIGFIPYIFIYVYAGNQLMDIKSSQFIYSILYFKLTLFGFFVLFYYLYKLIKKSINNKHEIT